jgi:hypothetical protein
MNLISSTQERMFSFHTNAYLIQIENYGEDTDAYIYID